MRKYRLPLIAVAVATVATLGCCYGPWGTSYPPLGTVTQIELKTHSGDVPDRVIDDPAEVLQVVEFVDGHRHGWGWLSGWAGVPVPQVSAYFYDGPRFKGHFGVRPGFFECQRQGDFASKSCSGRQQRRFLQLVGMSDFDLDR